jgi:hypothetical protein
MGFKIDFKIPQKVYFLNCTFNCILVKLIIKLLNWALITNGRRGEKEEREVVQKKVRKKCCNYLLGIIYKLLEDSRGGGKEVVRKNDKKSSKKVLKKFKKSSKKSSRKGRKKVRQKGSNDSIAEYCLMAEVRKKFEKKVQNKFEKKV